MPILHPSQYKSDQGVIRTKSLFYELCYDNNEFAVFTLKEDEHKHPSGRTLVSISKIFIEMAVLDPTEYNFAQHVFGSWLAWEKISNSDKRLVVHVEAWRREADVKRKSLGFKAVVEEVTLNGKSAFTAAKYLIEESWTSKSVRTADGRATRAKAQETAEEAFERSAISEDIQRLKDSGLLQ
jgi:hypothetical protein